MNAAEKKLVEVTRYMRRWNVDGWVTTTINGEKMAPIRLFLTWQRAVIQKIGRPTLPQKEKESISPNQMRLF